uniref:Ovule protein n=1 Tax=Panagrellus redivivus TaxID=6233 RepID=A0A7E4W198_PANRE
MSGNLRRTDGLLPPQGLKNSECSLDLMNRCGCIILSFYGPVIVRDGVGVVLHDSMNFAIWFLHPMSSPSSLSTLHLTSTHPFIDEPSMSLLVIMPELFDMTFSCYYQN